MGSFWWVCDPWNCLQHNHLRTHTKKDTHMRKMFIHHFSHYVRQSHHDVNLHLIQQSETASGKALMPLRHIVPHPTFGFVSMLVCSQFLLCQSKVFHQSVSTHFLFHILI